ncbi:MAG: CehA/McbA family metallohydrolase [Oscillospiraceae bacterium]|nr:CehA/McbA family metallohydrolase [Oscillospiraceae bacterium]
MKFDMHVHSRFSHDGHMTPAALFAAARRAGLAGLAVCDHNTLQGSRTAQAACPPDLCVIPGAEYSTEAGHMLAYFIETGAEEAGLPRDAAGRFALDALARFVREQGGLLIAAHPYRHRTRLPEDLPAHVDGWELFNARQMAAAPDSTPRTRDIVRACPGLVTAGSDAHLPAEVGRAYVESDAHTASALRAALEAGRYRCRGCPALRRHEALGRLRTDPPGAVRRLKSLLRLGVFAARDVRDWLLRRKNWEGFAPSANEITAPDPAQGNEDR